MKKLGIPFICLLLAACAVLKTNPPETSKPELEQFFQGREGAFVLYDLNADNYIRYNPKRCSEGFLPASTFKILNTLIGMETGVIPDEDFVISVGWYKISDQGMESGPYTKKRHKKFRGLVLPRTCPSGWQAEDAAICEGSQLWECGYFREY